MKLYSRKFALAVLLIGSVWGTPYSAHSQDGSPSPAVQPSSRAEGSPAPTTAPLIPPAPGPATTPAKESATPQPQASPQNPEAVAPLIPPAQPQGTATPSPSPAKAALAPETAQALEQQYQESLRVHRVRPKNLLFLGLMDAVRLALYQNPDLRMAGQDAESARAALKQATGDFDSRFVGLVAYSRTTVAAGANGQNPANINDVETIVRNSLIGTLQALQANPGANLNNLVGQQTQKASENQFNQTVQNLDSAITVAKDLRNGVGLTLEYSPVLTDQNDEPAWPPKAHSLSVSVSIPLTKFGDVAKAGKEIAAIKDYQASLLTMSHAATKATLDVVEAYWKASAALERFYISDRSYRISDALLSLSDQLVKADAIPATELSLGQARKSEALSKRSAALVEVLNASKALAKVLGLREEQLRQLPLASEPFPTASSSQIAQLNVNTLTDAALARRLDRAAALKSIEAKRVLAEKARIDLRPDAKLSFGGGVVVSENQGTSGGYRVDPKLNAAFVFSLPFANNAKEGALLDAEVGFNKSLLSLDGISREIASSVAVGVESLGELHRQIETARESVTYYTRSLNDMRERYRLGASTLIDTVQAEERLNNAELTLVDAKSTLAESIAQLRFESATILSKDTVMRVPSFPKHVEKLEISRDALTTLPDLTREPGPQLMDRNYEPNIKHISGHPPQHH